MTTFFAAKDGEVLYSPKTRPRADCGSDYQLLITKFRLKLKRVRKTTRPYMYDLNQVPDDYAVKMTNRFDGLDLVWTEDYVRGSKDYGQRFKTLYRR